MTAECTLTPEEQIARDVDALEGRPLDVAVAEEVMGDRQDADGMWVGPDGRVFGDVAHGPDVYSSECDSTFRVVGNLRKRGFRFTLQSDYGGEDDWRAVFFKAGAAAATFASVDDWVPQAICRAALKAVRTTAYQEQPQQAPEPDDAA